MFSPDCSCNVRTCMGMQVEVRWSFFGVDDCELDVQGQSLDGSPPLLAVLFSC